MSPLEQPAHPRWLAVVGAAAGVGRWLGDHVLAGLAWDRVVLLDASPAVVSLEHRYTAATTRICTAGTALPDLSAPGAAVCLAVPRSQLAAVANTVLPGLAPDAIVFDLSSDRTAASEAVAAAHPDLAAFGVHALFGTTAESADGQTFAVCPSAEHPTVHLWLRSAIEAAGGTINELTSEHHDDIMRYVQAATHQSLLCFADVLGRSGFDLDADLWANRTPVFELMLALASRVLAPGQELITAGIQLAAQQTHTHTGSPIDELAVAQRSLEAVLAGNDETALTEYVTALRAPFTGRLFTKMQQSGVLATSAVQSTRARIAEERRAGRLVGIRAVEQGDRLHVGTIERITPTSVVLLDRLVGTRGAAALLADGAGTANARRLGLGGRPRKVEFSLGRIRILGALELEAALDGWLTRVARGCKFLVPESISGRSAVRVVESVEHVDRAELISEEVRLGQRECVVRFHARVDRSLQDVEIAIQRRIDEVFVWPDGVVVPVANGIDRVGYLGPAGTFSDVAAQQLARLIGDPSTPRVEFPDFVSIVGAIAGHDLPLAVLPILNSSSGLVDLAAGVLADAPAGLRAGGVVDVPVRFDAFVPPGRDIVGGSQVLSHPQGFRQCSQFVAAHHLSEIVCTSTAEACRQVAVEGEGIALAAPGVGEEFGLIPARASVGNLAGALTRFLVIGLDAIFGRPHRDDPTFRSVWVVAPDVRLPETADARYDEIVRGPSGRALVVSTRPDRLVDGAGVRALGTIPWSPRTPLVMV